MDAKPLTNAQNLQQYLNQKSKLEKAVFGGQNAKAENTVDASEENEDDTKDHTIIFENN